MKFGGRDRAPGSLGLLVQVLRRFKKNIPLLSRHVMGQNSSKELPPPQGETFHFMLRKYGPKSMECIHSFQSIVQLFLTFLYHATAVLHGFLSLQFTLFII
ncbi:hypothetical protein ATANTOWER_030876 [Ataeniobius toweri]|uniref:Uncharacterized protein n=1 Tax=Ataeniobius toweri TaxID=208326 RepID=A0ABU7AI82_9TELE|nr:hypothetical protein [Ataeniobius toweri]